MVHVYFLFIKSTFTHYLLSDAHITNY